MLRSILSFRSIREGEGAVVQETRVPLLPVPVKWAVPGWMWPICPPTPHSQNMTGWVTLRASWTIIFNRSSEWVSSQTRVWLNLLFVQYKDMKYAEKKISQEGFFHWLNSLNKLLHTLLKSPYLKKIHHASYCKKNQHTGWKNQHTGW